MFAIDRVLLVVGMIIVALGLLTSALYGVKEYYAVEL